MHIQESTNYVCAERDITKCPHRPLSGYVWTYYNSSNPPQTRILNRSVIYMDSLSSLASSSFILLVLIFRYSRIIICSPLDIMPTGHPIGKKESAKKRESQMQKHGSKQRGILVSWKCNFQSEQHKFNNRWYAYNIPSAALLISHSRKKRESSHMTRMND